MSIPRKIFIGKRAYYLYHTFNEWCEAYAIAKQLKKEDGAKYYIQKREEGFWFRTYKFDLYTDCLVGLTDTLE